MAKTAVKKVGISKRSHVSDALVRQIRSAFEKSEQSISFADKAGVILHFVRPPIGSLEDHLFKQLAEILPSSRATGFDTHDLRDIARAFAVESAIAGIDNGWSGAILILLRPLSAGTLLKKADNAVWKQAATIARALMALDAFYVPDDRHRAAAEATKRLVANGYKVSVKHARPWVSHRDIKRATRAIQRTFDQFGIMNVLENLCHGMRPFYHFDQYLTGRRYSPTGHDPSIPFGFLVNLAVKAPDRNPGHRDPANGWREALELARDLVAVLDIEPQNQFWAINAAPKRLDNLLREIGLYDHLFGLRQWSPFITPIVLRTLFGTSHDLLIRQKHGWIIDDAVRLCEAVIQSARTDPARLTRADLKLRGLTDIQLDALLPHFVHSSGSVNARYLSPLLAEKADLMFRPLIATDNGSFIVPAASLAGPAFYEATMTAARAALPNSTVADITGKGTERVAEALLRYVKIPPSLIGEEYNVNKPDAGECDLVLEDSNHIVLIECKAKALTGAAMAGISGFALLDYAEGVLAAQAQALRTERLLRTGGSISFESGKRLEHRGREIVRLSVTLLDHGTLQDASLFWTLFGTVVRSTITAGGKHPRKKKIDEINDLIAAINRETSLIGNAGHKVEKTILGGASVSIGQLAIFLVGATDLAHLVKRINARVTANTGSPLLEFHHLRSQGLLS